MYINVYYACTNTVCMYMYITIQYVCTCTYIFCMYIHILCVCTCNTMYIHVLTFFEYIFCKAKQSVANKAASIPERSNLISVTVAIKTPPIMGTRAA